VKGNYTIKGYVLYEGKKTETQELTFMVIEPQPGNVAEMTPTVAATENTPEDIITDGNGLAAYWYVIIVLGGAAVAAAVYLFVWRRQKFAPAFAGSYNRVFHDLAHNKLFRKIRIFRFNRAKINRKRTRGNGKK
jgi:hypothetical protein